MRRRVFLTGASAWVVGAAAHADAGARAALPGGGSVRIPAGYALERPPEPGERAATLYRNLRYNMGGVRVCDGFIVVAGPGQYADWEAFAQAGRAAGTSGWQSPANAAFQGDADGKSHWRPVSVTIVGMWRVYEAPAVQAVFEAPSGLRAQIWMFEKNGGLRAARKIANDIFASYARSTNQ